MRAIARNWRRVLMQMPDERLLVPQADVFYTALGGGAVLAGVLRRLCQRDRTIREAPTDAADFGTFSSQIDGAVSAPDRGQQGSKCPVCLDDVARPAV